MTNVNESRDCSMCGAPVGPRTTFCGHCRAYVGTPCPSCRGRVGLSVALCECGELVVPPAEVLETMRRARRGAGDPSSGSGDALSPSSGPVPAHPGTDEWPARDPGDTMLVEMLGRTVSFVISRLGRATERAKHRVSDPGPAVFGPRPTAIPEGTRYEEWTYRNLRGQDWILWCARPADLGHGESGANADAESIVVEVHEHAFGAVF